MKLLLMFLFSSVQAALSTILSLGLALPLAHFFYRFRFPGRTFFLALASLLCIMPTKLIALSIAQFFGASGFVGIILAHLMLNLPFSLFVLNVTYQKLDMTQLWVATDLGASPWQVYRDVVLPFLRGTIVSMGVILFLLHAASYSIPLVLGGQWYHLTPEVLMSQLYNEGQSGSALLLWVLRVLVFVPLLLLHGRSARKVVLSSDVAHTVPCPRYRIGDHGIGWLAYALFVALLTLGPFGALLLQACDSKVFSFFKSVVGGAADACLGVPVRLVVFNSIALAIVSGVCAVAVACIIGAVARLAHNRYASGVVALLTVLPFVFGSVGIGMLFAWFSYGKVVSAFLIGVLCHIVLNYPFAYRVVDAQFALYHPDMHKTAQTFGASHNVAVRTVTLPFVRSALIKAFCISFGLSLTEVGAGSVLHNKMGLTIAMAIRLYRKAGMHTELIGLSMVLLVLVLLVSYFLSSWMG